MSEDRDYVGTRWRSNDLRDNGRIVVVTRMMPWQYTGSTYLELHNAATGRKSFIRPKNLESGFTEVIEKAPVALEDLLTDAIDAYLTENYGFLSGDKEAGYTIDGYVGPRFLAQRLVTIIEEHHA